MNKAQKEVQQVQLDDEKKVIKLLERVYEQAKKDCEQKIRELSARTDLENLQSIIYQKQYQEAIKKQLDGILEELHTNQFTNIADYLQKSYNNGFIGTMYDLRSQGIPMIIPIQQEQVVKAVQTDSNLSSNLYTKLGEDTNYLKKSIRAELSRGISSGSTWNEMAVRIAKGMNSPFRKSYNNAIRIARTEGHRIQNQAALDGQYGAKKKGADIVKQWDATLDGRTRDEHRLADGQIRELDEPFDIGGEKMQAPGIGGSARNVCNCRCCLLQRARWALDEDELETLKERTEYFGLDKSKDFEDFKQKYLKLPEDADTVEIQNTTFAPAKTIEEAQSYAQKFIEDGYSPTFKGVAVYKGLSLDHANEINKTLEELYARYGMPKLKGLKTISPTSAQGKKVFKDGEDAVAAYNPVEGGIFLNKNILKDAKSVSDYNKKSDDAWKLVMDNIDKLSGKQKELALTYKNAGRDLVGDGSVHDYIVHEMGHHVQWKVLDVKTNNAIGENMKAYAPKISGYANASKSEYIAESFVSLVKGEVNKVDPVFADYMKNGIAKTSNDGIIKAGVENVKRNTSVLPTLHLQKDEYAHVTSEINTNMSEEQRQLTVVSKAIGDYIYTFENHGFNDYRIIGKVPIESDEYDEIERIFNENE